MVLASGNPIIIIINCKPWGPRLSPRHSSPFCTPSLRQSPPPKTRLLAKIAMSSQNQVREDQTDGGGGPGISIPPGFSEIVVVRHGETAWNASRIIQGHLDSELNDVGRKQASAVGDKLAKEAKYAAIYASDLKRASETAQIIATTCNVPEVIKDPALRERHIGDLQGQTLRDAAKLKPVAYKIFMSHNRDQEIPGGGESHNQLYERCTSVLERIARQHVGERVIAVTHGGVLRELYRRACPAGSPDGRIQNTSVNVFHISESGDKWIIKKWGDVSHLRKVGVLEDSFGGDRTSA